MQPRDRTGDDVAERVREWPGRLADMGFGPEVVAAVMFVVDGGGSSSGSTTWEQAVDAALAASMARASVDDTDANLPQGQQEQEPCPEEPPAGPSLADPAPEQRCGHRCGRNRNRCTRFCCVQCPGSHTPVCENKFNTRMQTRPDGARRPSEALPTNGPTTVAPSGADPVQATRGAAGTPREPCELRCGRIRNQVSLRTSN